MTTTPGRHGQASITIGAAVEQYLAERQPEVAATTFRCDALDLRRFVKSLGDPKMSRITQSMVREHFYGPRGRVNLVQGSTFNAERARVNAFFEWALELGYITQSPMRRVKRQRTGSRERVRLTPEQLAELIELEDYPRDRALLALGANTGLRASAITPLRIKDVDLGQGWLLTYSSKTDKQVKLPISADLDAELRVWIKEYQRACGTPHPDWFLVPSRHRGLDGKEGERSRLRPTQQMCYQTALRIVHNALDRIGLDHKGAGTHTLRRSCGRALFDALVEAGDARAIHVVKELYGHEDIRLTSVYIGTSDEKQALDTALRGQAFLSRKRDDGAEVVSLAEMRRKLRSS